MVGRGERGGESGSESRLGKAMSAVVAVARPRTRCRSRVRVLREGEGCGVWAGVKAGEERGETERSMRGKVARTRARGAARRAQRVHMRPLPACTQGKHMRRGGRRTRDTPQRQRGRDGSAAEAVRAGRTEGAACHPPGKPCPPLPRSSPPRTAHSQRTRLPSALGPAPFVWPRQPSNRAAHSEAER